MITDEQIRELRADEMYCALARYIAASAMRERLPLDPIVARVASGHAVSVKSRTDIAVMNRGWVSYAKSGVRVVTSKGIEAWRLRISELEAS